MSFAINKNEVREQTVQGREVRILGYDVGRSIRIKLLDLSKYDALINGLLSLDGVGSMNTNFDRTDREEIEQDLRKKTVANARMKAELLAQAFGVRIGSIFAISEYDFNSIGMYFHYAGGPDFVGIGGTSEDVFFRPSKIKLWGEIRTIFRLETD